MACMHLHFIIDVFQLGHKHYDAFNGRRFIELETCIVNLQRGERAA